VIAAFILDVHEEIVLEQGFFDDLVTIAPPAANLVDWKKGLDVAVLQIFVNLFFVAGAGIYRVPGH